MVNRISCITNETHCNELISFFLLQKVISMIYCQSWGHTSTSLPMLWFSTEGNGFSLHENGCSRCALQQFPLQMRYCPPIKVTNGTPEAYSAPLASLNPPLIAWDHEQQADYVSYTRIKITNSKCAPGNYFIVCIFLNLFQTVFC